MQDKIQNLISSALKNLEIEEVDFVVEHPEDFKNGDYSTNIAMVCAKKIKTNPKDLAEKIANEIGKNLTKEVEKVEAVGGFINFYLSQEFFKHSVEDILNKKDFAENKLHTAKNIMIEYTDPNPFKPFHIGHLMTNAIGESIARILENSGAKVSRANYQGDVGLHVAKAVYGLLKNKKLQDDSVATSLQAENIGKAYAMGSEAYTENKHEIDEINKKVYSRSDDEINKIYDWGLKVTMNAFEDIYDMLGTQFDFYFLESLMAPIGEKIVRENLGKIFEESDDAIVFKAEKYDPKLHTRVFITSQGLPTYETKELGLAKEKFKTKPDTNLSIVVTANEQADYMKVVAKALSLIHPEYENKMKHITHGMMRFAEGKMSSRKGNVITGEVLINDTKNLVNEKMKDKNFGYDENTEIVSKVAVAAIKYSILKQSTGGDIMYDFEKSISFEGDSGPYLQYSYARASSVLEKAQKENILPDPHVSLPEVTEVEKLLYRFPEVVRRAAEEYEPHYIANYLIELARSFNSFYGNNIIVSKDDKTSSYKVALTYAFSFVMKKGLHLLGIDAPVRM
ncbi:arginine--tRNA ligase [Candidatus Nomurabacteria bacterium]|nr:arginine--tRNA ligase [Candidatus Nomurabacteria bacterium]